MRLHRLHVEHFGGIREVDVELGPGLNILYGPNDLGKSTLVSAIRLALLLPHTSTHSDPYVAWSGGEDPMVEITFESEAQRIWRVRKQFGKGGLSLLHESKNGRDFDQVERGRKVNAKLREILRWGIPEPGGAGGGKGMPTSFLATALLSAQSDVSAVLNDSLRGDSADTGKQRIAEALQAIAQDPLFVALLRDTQKRRDDAYTDKGARKTAKGSVFKDAAERLREAREEKERFQRIVADSEGAERQLRELTEKRAQRQEAFAQAQDCLAGLERIALQTADRFKAAESVRSASEEVQRIRKIAADAGAAERQVGDLSRKISDAEQALRLAQGRHAETCAALVAAEESARADGSDPGATDTVLRRQLELRNAAAEQSARDALQRIDVAVAARKLAEAAISTEAESRDQQAKADAARESASRAAEKEKAATDELRRCDLLERVIDLQSAEKQVAVAQAAVDNETALQARMVAISTERAALAARRATILVPISAALAPMRKLANELTAARAALDVGFVVTVSPNSRLELRIRKDRNEADYTTTAEPLEFEAKSEVEVTFGEVGTVRVRGGRREAHAKARSIEDKWSQEVAPHLKAAGVADLDGLEAKVGEAREVDTGIAAKDAAIQSLRDQIAMLAGAADVWRGASQRADACRAALGDIGIETLAADLKMLGPDPTAGLRKRRQRYSTEVEAARQISGQAANSLTLADERARSLRSALEAAVLARDSALTAFPEGVDAAWATAQAGLAASKADKENVAVEMASLDNAIEARRKRIDAALSGARAAAEKAKSAVESAQESLTKAIAAHASENGRLIELRKQRDAENLAVAEAKLKEATERHAALPVPDRVVADEEVAAAKKAEDRISSELATLGDQVKEAQGALKQVGGAVARERLRDATEAFDLAEQREREIEAEYDAWKLLLEQMKEADAAQASNLGLVLAPAIAAGFQALTQKRYESLQLTAELGTDGIVVGGTVRSTERISVGTREQLSTLYRLSLAEYLRTAVVLDDQLVQSDDARMVWFRSLLAEKSRNFQIVVFTCRPSDYLAPKAKVAKGTAIHADSDNGFVRAIDLGRAILRL